MELVRLTVGGFRNLAQTTIEMGGLCALVSPNNYGKSNLLDAIDFGVEFLNASPRSRAAMMSYVAGMPLVPALSDAEYRFLVEFSDEELGEYRCVRYGYSFSWLRDDGCGQTVTDEILEMKDRPEGRWTSYLKRREGKYRKSYDTRSFRTIHLDGDQLAIDVLTAIEDIDINPVIKRIKGLKFSLCAALDASPRFRPLPIESASRASAAVPDMFDDDDLPEAMYFLKERHPDRYDMLLSALYTLFPEFQEISVDPYEIQPELHDRLEKSLSGSADAASVPYRIRDVLYKVSVLSRHLNQAVDVSMMSDGTKRIIWLLTNVMIAGLGGTQCMGIEEIETSIHPRLLGELLETLDESRGDNTLLMTSHSPFLIQYVKPRQIYIGVPNDDGVAQFRRIREEAQDAIASNAYDKGLGFGEYLFELMSSEGDDAALLASFLEREHG